MTDISVGNLGDRVRQARLYSPTGIRWPNPMPLDGVRRRLAEHGVYVSVDWLESLESGDNMERVPAETVLQLSRVLGCSLLYLLGVES